MNEKLTNQMNFCCCCCFVYLKRGGEQRDHQGPADFAERNQAGERGRDTEEKRAHRSPQGSPAGAQGQDQHGGQVRQEEHRQFGLADQKEVRSDRERAEATNRGKLTTKHSTLNFKERRVHVFICPQQKLQEQIDQENRCNAELESFLKTTISVSFRLIKC